MSLTSLMIHTVTVRRLTRTFDATDGGWTEAWANEALNVSCRIQPLSAKEVAEQQSVNSEINCRIYFLPAADVLFEDRLIHGVDTIEVVGVRDIDRWARFTTVDGYISPVITTTSTTTTTTTTTPAP